MSEKLFICAKTGVYWDVVDCPLPVDLSPDMIYANIESGLESMGYHGELSTIWAYTKKVPESEFFDYNAVGIMMVREKGDQYDRVDRMTRDILFFALDNPKRPTNLMIIANNMSMKPELIRVLQSLKSRNINVVVAQPDALVPVELHGIVTGVCLSKSLLDGGKATMLELDPEIKNVTNLDYFQQVSKRPSYESIGNTGVFWNTKGCPDPKALELDFCSIDKSIKSCLASMDKSGSRVTSISAYEVGGKVTVWNGGSDTKMVLHKGYRLQRMLLDILLWAIDNRVGQYLNTDREPNVMVITRDIPKGRDFNNTLKFLSARDCNIIFGVPDELKSVSSWTTLTVFGEPFFSSHAESIQCRDSKSL
ncbi:unnamed protein product [Microthlaspi erraticum]|uniref:NYN domain-containing protein n=1 Tax=Microthlaspi erraticum TaxID=1685480 RepID=A0A6D2LJX4_9BRAS|nr:unnamed protein product [Microthlaspi erraticum]